MFIDEECGNLKVDIDGGKFTSNINQKKTDALHAYRWPLSDKCCGQGYFFKKQLEYCESVFNLENYLPNIEDDVSLIFISLFSCPYKNLTVQQT